MLRTRPESSYVPGVGKIELSSVWWRGFVRKLVPKGIWKHETQYYLFQGNLEAGILFLGPDFFFIFNTGLIICILLGFNKHQFK